MPRRKQIHVPGGTYYTVRKTLTPFMIFLEPNDYEEFEDFLAPVLEATGTKLLAYCWLPDAVHLTVIVGRRPIAELMRRVTRYCAERVRERFGPDVKPFPAEFPITLIDPEAYLARVIHYVHRLPVHSGIAAAPDEYPYTSYSAYRGAKQYLRLHTNRVLTLLDHFDSSSTTEHQPWKSTAL